MAALLKSVWSLPSRLARHSFVLMRILFIVLISIKDGEMMEFAIIMRIVRAMSVGEPDGFWRDKGDRIELGVKFEVLVDPHDDLDEIGE